MSNVPGIPTQQPDLTQVVARPRLLTTNHPLAFWVGNSLEITVSGTRVYYVDDLAFGCNPADLDGDGWWGVMEDCDDTDATIGPGQPDPIDGVDRDCDGFDGPA